MASRTYPYIIIGGGLAAASAVQGIREINRSDPILLFGREKDPPYHRPPLSKKLWFGKMKLEEIYLHPESEYSDLGVDLELGKEIISLDPSRKEIRDKDGKLYHYLKLLLATGGTPRRLRIPGGELEGISYYRDVGDFKNARKAAVPGASALVIGGGFIGSEIAAALRMNQVEVSMVFPEGHLVHRVFPESLGRAIQARYLERGIRVYSGDLPVSIGRSGRRFVTQTREGRRIESDLLIVGIGIEPSTALARGANLAVSNGILVDECQQTSDPDVFAAGDNASFPYVALGRRMRVEHWDHALHHGKNAGRNMAGAGEPYDYLPYFFSDLFEFGYEAVGEVDSALETVMDWQKENETGVIYYTRDGVIRGAMMCNVWNKMDWARERIRNGERITPDELTRAA